jgi:hypothetical protein
LPLWYLQTLVKVNNANEKGSNNTNYHKNRRKTSMSTEKASSETYFQDNFDEGFGIALAVEMLVFLLFL